LYEETDIFKAAMVAEALSEIYPDDLTPSEMWNPVLSGNIGIKQGSTPRKRR
jgi:hypothetical protein